MNTSNRLSRYKPSVWFVIAILCHTLPSISSEGLLMIKNTEPPITLLPTGQTFPLNQASLLNGEILTENEDNLPTDGSTTIEPGSLEREEVIVSPFKSVAMDQVQSPDIGETTVTSTSPTTTESIVATPTEDSTINLSTQNHTTTTSRLHKATTDQPLAASTLSSVDSLKTQEVDSSTVTVSQPSTMETTGQLPHRTEQVSTLQSVELTTESSLEFTTPNNFLISTMSEDQTAATKNEQDLKETKFTQFATTMTPTLATESIKSTTETSTKASTSQNTESNANLSFKSQFATPSLVKEAEPVTESLNVQDSEFITATSSDESAVKTFEPPQDVNSSTAKDAETTTFKLNTTSTTVQPSSTEFLNETLTKFDSIQQDLKKPTTEVLFEAQPTSATTAVIDAGVATESVLKQTTVQKIEAFTTQKSEELTISNNADLTTRPSSSSLQPIMATNVNVSTESSTQSATINNLNSTKDNGLEFVTMTESKFSTATTPSSTFEASLGSLETERLVSTAQPATESMTETNFKLTTSTTTERFATPSIETSTQATNDEMSRPNENGGFRNFDNTEFVSKFATNPTTTANESNVDFVANELSPSDVTSTTSSTIPVVFPTTFPDPFNVPINSTPNEVSNVPVLFPINPPPVVPGIVSRPKNLAETTLTIDELFNMNANMIKTFNHQPKPLSRIPNLPPRVVFPANMPVRFPTPQEDARSRTNEIPLPKNVTLPDAGPCLVILNGLNAPGLCRTRCNETEIGITLTLPKRCKLASNFCPSSMQCCVPDLHPAPCSFDLFHQNPVHCAAPQSISTNRLPLTVSKPNVALNGADESRKRSPLLSKIHPNTIQPLVFVQNIPPVASHIEVLTRHRVRDQFILPAAQFKDSLEMAAVQTKPLLSSERVEPVKMKKSAPIKSIGSSFAVNLAPIGIQN